MGLPSLEPPVHGKEEGKAQDPEKEAKKSDKHRHKTIASVGSVWPINPLSRERRERVETSKPRGPKTREQQYHCDANPRSMLRSGDDLLHESDDNEKCTCIERRNVLQHVDPRLMLIDPARMQFGVGELAGLCVLHVRSIRGASALPCRNLLICRIGQVTRKGRAFPQLTIA